MDRSNFDPQVGDSVRVRSWEDMKSEFGIDEDGNIPCRFSFTEYMKDMCGMNLPLRRFTMVNIADMKRGALCCRLICSNLSQKKKSTGRKLMIS